MKAGYQTIIFGSRLDDLEAKLAVISEAGFTGIEFSQRQEMLRVYDPLKQHYRPVTLTELGRLLQRYNLTFLGLAGGTLEERIQFCLSVPEFEKDPTIQKEYYHPLYLYVDTDDVEDLELAAMHNFQLAIHPHVFMKCERMASARQLPHTTRKHVFIMPDTAHAYIVGDDPTEEIRSLGVDKLVAVHLKDWDSAYGRSSHRYAKGFVPFGSGEVPLEHIIALLRKIGFEGWIIAEQDYARHSAEQSVIQAAKWFTKHGILSEPSKPTSQPTPIFPVKSTSRDEHIDASSQFAQAVDQAESQSVSDCYGAIAKALWHQYHSCHVSIWACSPARDDICLLSAYPSELQSPTEVAILDKKLAILGLAADTLRVETFALADVATKYPTRKLYWSAVAAQTGAKAGVAIPVPNRFNPHHIRFVVGLLQPEIGAYDWIEEADIITSNVSRTVDLSLDDTCMYAAGRVNCIAAETTSLDDFLKKLTALIQKSIACQGVTIFLTNRTNERLEVKATTGITWAKTVAENARYYMRSEMDHPTAKAWLEKKTILLAHAQQRQWNHNPHPPRSHESGPGISQHNDNIMLMPIVSITKNEQGKQNMEAVGVIRCRNKQQDNSLHEIGINRLFTDDDAAILDAICQTATPHIELRRSHEERIKAIANMTHELNVPINSLRAAIDRLQYRIKKDKPDYAKLLTEDYFERIFSLTDLNVRVVNNAALYGMGYDQLKLQKESTWLKGEVIAPAKSQVRFLLQERGFDIEGIQYSEFTDVEKLYIDRNQFQQVCFNLLSNAIKYAYADPKRFRMEIQSATHNGYYCIAFRDWGPGIAEVYAPYVFEEGVRGPNALAEYVRGLGIGLWIVRRIVEAHDGYVAVTHNYQPTEITIFLPITLRASSQKRK